MGAACGIFMFTAVKPEELFGGKISDFILNMLILLLMIFVASYIQSAIHEGGHLLFGLLSGYKFISFRIGPFMFIENKGKIRIKRFNLVGTAGQCLMMPPEWNGKTPFFFYHMGGCIINLVSGFVFILLFIAAGKEGFFAAFMGMLSAVGFGYALMNGIPLYAGGISNDGKNTLCIAKNQEAMRASWLQLYVNGLISKGERMRNMPEDWFFLPEGEGLSDPIICTVGVMRYNYYFDSHEFEKAEETVEYMLGAPGLLDLHKNELKCELLCLRIMRGASSGEVEELLTPELRKYIRATGSYVSRKRLDYAYQLLYRKDITLAQKSLEQFEKVARSYPYSAEIENEKEVIEIIRAKSEIY